MLTPTPASRLQSVCRQFLKICGETYHLDENHVLARTHKSTEIGIRAMNVNFAGGKEFILISCIMGGPLPLEDRYVELTVEELEGLSVLGEDYA